MLRNDYLAQVGLLLDCLPSLREQDFFALKGGTAINFFMCDLPRLSVDIDLTFLNADLERSAAIEQIGHGLRYLAEEIKKQNPHFVTQELKTRDDHLHKLLVFGRSAMIKIEPNFIMRGSLLPPVLSEVCQSIQDEFAYHIKDIPLICSDELYAGKICAALSRQHPRDFFDIKILLERRGLTRGVISAFVVYLACSPRPMHELLDPNMVLDRGVYQTEFVNMTEVEVSFESLLETRAALVREINEGLSDKEQQFLISVKEGETDCGLLPYDHLDQLPALKWKTLNVKKMDQKKHLDALNKLKHVLGRSDC